jgi:hypothetical protein
MPTDPMDLPSPAAFYIVDVDDDLARSWLPWPEGRATAVPSGWPLGLSTSGWIGMNYVTSVLHAVVNNFELPYSATPTTARWS